MQVCKISFLQKKAAALYKTFVDYVAVGLIIGSVRLDQSVAWRFVP